jgi:hypothetical protein
VGEVVGRLLAGQLDARLGDITREQRQRGDDLFDRVRALITSSPAPVVNVTLPSDAIRVLTEVKQLPAEVHVAIPEHAIKIEHKSILDMPKRKSKVIKKIQYGQTGRPETIEEETLET